MNKAALRGAMALALFASAGLTASSASAALLPQSWNGWSWARTGTLNIKIGDNVSAAWDPYLKTAAAAWSAADNINFVVTSGATSASICGPVYGTVQICSGNYGKTGYLGYTNVYTSGTSIVMATIKLNDYYFSQSKYNNDAWRSLTICQETGHSLGLAGSDTDFKNTNLGSCMDYTNDPTGTKGTNGTLANTGVSVSDMANLNAIYAKPGKSQLPTTKITIGGDAMLAAVPEPATWAMFILGFGAIGTAARRRRTQLTFGADRSKFQPKGL